MKEKWPRGRNCKHISCLDTALKPLLLNKAQLSVDMTSGRRPLRGQYSGVSSCSSSPKR
ncbi:hypothetical protein BT69DRAFT_1284775 [Atractiella rhizophila]|nr:hypothetical protein BT69DRAFT_1284775 [Atractiella rhizophila]